MSRYYTCHFQSESGDEATTVGSGNTRRTAERSARRKLPAPPTGKKLRWDLIWIEPKKKSL
jgi:hypothetical protein